MADTVVDISNPVVELDKEVDKVLKGIEVVGDVKDYVRAYLELNNELDEADSIVVTVDSDKPMSSKTYLEIAERAGSAPDKSYVYMQAESIGMPQVALLHYLKGRGIKATYNIDELARWVTNAH